jgi:hypothetical protein
MERQTQSAARPRLRFLLSYTAFRCSRAALGGPVTRCNNFLPCLALLAKFPESGNSLLLFFKIFFAIAAFVCIAVLILRVFGKLLVDVFGILDGRSPRSNNRYA